MEDTLAVDFSRGIALVQGQRSSCIFHDHIRLGPPYVWIKSQRDRFHLEQRPARCDPYCMDARRLERPKSDLLFVLKYDRQ